MKLYLLHFKIFERSYVGRKYEYGLHIYRSQVLTLIVTGCLNSTEKKCYQNRYLTKSQFSDPDSKKTLPIDK